MVIYIYPFIALVLTDVSINDNMVMEISVSAQSEKSLESAREKNFLPVKFFGKSHT